MKSAAAITWWTFPSTAATSSLYWPRMSGNWAFSSKRTFEDLDAYYLERNRMVEEALKRRKLIESIFRNMLSGLMVFDHQGIILSGQSSGVQIL